MFPYRYASEKLSTAVHILATGPGDVRSRLWPAYLEFHPLKPEDFPEELQSDYEWVMHELTKREPQFPEWSELEQDYVIEGRVPANLRRMRNSTGAKIAERIYHLSFQIEMEFEKWRESLRRNSQS